MRSALKLITFFSIYWIYTACASQQDVISYFQDTETLPDSIWRYCTPTEAVLKADDELSIVVSAVDQNAATAFNKSCYTQQYSNSRSLSTLPSVLTYHVDADGQIDFPVLGRLQAAGCTANQLRDTLVARLTPYMHDPMVTVSLLNYMIPVLGEVNVPGLYQPNRNTVTLLEALGERGDLSIYGDRQHVLLMRTENGHTEPHRIDLTSAAFMSSPYYYLQPGDVIYVPANQARRDMARYNNLKQYNLTILSTIVSCVSVLSTLGIAIWK